MNTIAIDTPFCKGTFELRMDIVPIFDVARKYHIVLSLWEKDSETGFDECAMQITKIHPYYHPDEPYQVLIKDYSENIGIYQELVRLGIVSDEFFRIPAGHTYLVCTQIVNQEMKKQIDLQGVAIHAR